MMFLSYILQEAPANTTNYMIYGYAVIFGVMILYIASLYLRQRSLKQDIELIQDIKEE